MPLISANDTELYYEVRGSGPPLLLIMGASGYGGAFDRFAQLLSDEFTVVTYDRRGNGRSPRPAGWQQTSPEEQADDAAALLATLGLRPAVVFGTSSGGIFALAMSIQHPDAVRAAIIHEPALFSLFDDPADVRDQVSGLVREGMEAGGRTEAFERFLRFAAGDENWEGLDAGTRAGILASADTYFEYEIGRFDAYVPTDETLGAISAPIQLLVGDGSHPEFAQAAGRLAPRLGVEITRTTGTHFPYLDHPEELAGLVSSFARLTVAER